MSQAAFLRDLDNAIMGSFVSAGLGDLATCVFSGVTTPDVRCLVDISDATAGENGGVSSKLPRITLYLSDITPRQQMRVIIQGAYPQTFELAKREDRDESREIWTAQVVRA
jgi:hypothetical protein